MRALAIAATDVRRLFRWRANVFFLLVLPMLIILLLGAAFGTQSARIGVVDRSGGPLSTRLVAALDARPSTTVVGYHGVARLQEAVARGNVDAGVVVPAGYDTRLARGEGVSLDYFARPNSVAEQLRATIQSVASGQGRTLAAAATIARTLHLPFAAALERARTAERSAPALAVSLTATDGSRYASTLGRFDSGATTQLLLFIFLNSLNGAAWLIEARRLGVARRILSTPTSVGELVAGELLGRLAIALIQALIIVLGSLLVFGVSWGDPLGTGAVILSFSLVSTGGAVLLGSLFASEQQAGPVALLLGLGLAALGGSMAPLEIFPAAARAIAHATPHAWANDAFATLLKHGGGLVDVLPQVGVLLAFAAVLTAAALWRLRRVLTA